jgi:hypothetical protein
MPALEGQVRMNGQTPDQGAQQIGRPSQWLIVQHVPISSGRALPAPTPGADARIYQAANTGDAENMDDGNEDGRDNLELESDVVRSDGDPRSLAVTAPRPQWHERPSPPSRPLRADLDEFLLAAAESQLREQPVRAHFERIAAEQERQARRTWRLHTLVFALIVFIVIFAIVVVGMHLSQLGLKLPTL